jgi:hypothetical protein
LWPPVVVVVTCLEVVGVALKTVAEEEVIGFCPWPDVHTTFSAGGCFSFAPEVMLADLCLVGLPTTCEGDSAACWTEFFFLPLLDSLFLGNSLSSLEDMMLAQRI